MLSDISKMKLSDGISSVFQMQVHAFGLRTHRTNPLAKNSEINICNSQILCVLAANLPMSKQASVYGSKHNKVVTKTRKELEFLSRVLMEDIFQGKRMKM